MQKTRTYLIPNQLGRALLLAAWLLLIVVPAVYAQDGGEDALPFMDFATFMVWVQGLLVMLVIGVLFEKWAWFQGMSGAFKNRATVIITGAIAAVVAYATSLVPDAWIGQFDVLVTSTYTAPLFFLVKEIFHSYVGKNITSPESRPRTLGTG